MLNNPHLPAWYNRRLQKAAEEEAMSKVDPLELAGEIHDRLLAASGAKPNKAIDDLISKVVEAVGKAMDEDGIESVKDLAEVFSGALTGEALEKTPKPKAEPTDPEDAPLDEKAAGARGLRKSDDPIGTLQDELKPLLLACRALSGEGGEGGISDLAAHLEQVMDEWDTYAASYKPEALDQLKIAESAVSGAVDRVRGLYGSLNDAKRNLGKIGNKTSAAPVSGLRKVALALESAPASWSLDELAATRKALSLELGKAVTISVTDPVPGVYHKGVRIGSLVGGQALVKKD